MKPVFVDTGAFAALFLEDDGFHARALDAFRRMANQRRPLVTTNAVVFETHALLLARGGERVATAFLDWIDGTSAARIERVSAADELAARALTRSHRTEGWSLCDAMSFVVMRRLHIGEALAYDQHFRQAGATIVSEKLSRYGSRQGSEGAIQEKRSTSTKKQRADAAWLEEIERRVREIDAGTATLKDWSVVRDRLLRRWTPRTAD